MLLRQLAGAGGSCDVRPANTDDAGGARVPCSICPAALGLPLHAVVLALLYARELLSASVGRLPAALSTPSKVLLAGLVLADAYLCDATVPMRAWAAATPARGCGAQVAAIEAAALDELQFGIAVDAATHSRASPLTTGRMPLVDGNDDDDNDAAAADAHRSKVLTLAALAASCSLRCIARTATDVCLIANPHIAVFAIVITELVREATPAPPTAATIATAARAADGEYSGEDDANVDDKDDEIIKPVQLQSGM
ncbi:hypothetical protein HK405_004120 [Cladochytrium tenue]|nr:hypothetical protein HK405_004120 [Cladochytrium tenue]